MIVLWTLRRRSAGDHSGEKEFLDVIIFVSNRYAGSIIKRNIEEIMYGILYEQR